MPLFPDNKNLEKNWWHRFSKIIGFFFYYIALITICALMAYYIFVGVIYVFGNKSVVLKLKGINFVSIPYPSGSTKLIDKDKFYDYVQTNSDTNFENFKSFRDKLGEELKAYSETIESDSYSPKSAIPETARLYNEAYHTLEPINVFHQKYWKYQFEQGNLFYGIFSLILLIPYIITVIFYRIFLYVVFGKHGEK